MYQLPGPQRPLSVLWGVLVIIIGLYGHANAGPDWWMVVTWAGVPSALLLER